MDKVQKHNSFNVIGIQKYQCIKTDCTHDYVICVSQCGVGLRIGIWCGTL
jgi:hypothetical protein